LANQVNDRLKIGDLEIGAPLQACLSESAIDQRPSPPASLEIDERISNHEGPRTYIERINIRGNSRTRDYVILREFDISEGLQPRAGRPRRAPPEEPRLLQEHQDGDGAGSSSDRVILNVDLEEKSTGDFSISGGYSTSDGALAEVSISERNLLGRGLYGKASVSYGQYSRGASLSFVEPYLFGQRLALGLDLSYKQQLQTSHTSYGVTTMGFSPRIGCRAPPAPPGAP